MADPNDSDYHGNVEQPEGEASFAASACSAPNREGYWWFYQNRLNRWELMAVRRHGESLYVYSLEHDWGGNDARDIEKHISGRWLYIPRPDESSSPREIAEARQVAPGKKNRDVAHTAESCSDTRVLAPSGGQMSPMAQNDPAHRPEAERTK